MGKYIIFGSAVVVTVILMIFGRQCLNKKANAKPKTEKVSNILRQSKVYLYIGIGGIIIFSLISLYAVLRSLKVIKGYTEVDWIASIIFLLIDLPYVYMILLRMNWRIEIGKTSFSFRNIFGKKRVYSYDNIEIKVGGCNKYYYKGKHVVSVSHLVINWFDLENAINKNIQKKINTNGF